MNDKGKKISIVLGIVLLGYIGIGAIAYLSKPRIEIPSDAITSKVECPASYDSYASTTLKEVILKGRASNGTGGKLKGYRLTIERTGLTSDIACGYLHYEVSFAGKPIEEKSMSLVMRPTDSKLGGHIIPNEREGAIVQRLPDRTEILIPLNSITYDGLTRHPIRTANWAALLNVATDIEFEIALSADHPGGRIDLLEIAYKCVNRETGKETTTCSIGASEAVSFGFE